MTSKLLKSYLYHVISEKFKCAFVSRFNKCPVRERKRERERKEGREGRREGESRGKGWVGRKRKHKNYNFCFPDPGSHLGNLDQGSKSYSFCP